MSTTIIVIIVLSVFLVLVVGFILWRQFHKTEWDEAKEGFMKKHMRSLADPDHYNSIPKTF
jgi:flagellar basal body-associated protein FliL